MIRSSFSTKKPIKFYGFFYGLLWEVYGFFTGRVLRVEFTGSITGFYGLFTLFYGLSVLTRFSLSWSNLDYVAV